MNQTSSDSNNWFVCPKTNSRAEMRLFLFPYAGGSPSAFWKWASEFTDHCEIWIAHYPGRGSRYNEPPIKEISVLIKRFYLAIQSFLDKPFAFFGHSLGGLIAFELVRALRRINLPEPNILFISACDAPQLPDLHPSIHTISDAEFLKALWEFNGIPIEILNHPELMELLLPTIRADFEIFERYNYAPNEPPLTCPIIALGGENDPRVSREGLDAWKSQTNSTFRSKYFPGDHFFINDMKDAVIHTITEEIMSSATQE